MTLNIRIKMDNSAFEPSPGVEVARILHDLANRCEENDCTPGDSVGLRDFNGNKVGTAEVVA